MTMVSEESMEVDTSEQRKSTDTSGSSTTARMPAHDESSQPQKTDYDWKLQQSTGTQPLDEMPRPDFSRARACGGAADAVQLGRGRTLGGAAGRLTEGLVDLLSEGLLLHLQHQVDDGHVGRRHPQRNACTTTARVLAAYVLMCFCILCFRSVEVCTAITVRPSGRGS